MEATSEAVFELDAEERFIYEYGRFILTWNFFEFYVEALVWYFRTKYLHEDLISTQNFREINHLSTTRKRYTCMSYLKRSRRKDVIAALEKVYDVAERNKWVHGMVIPDRYVDEDGEKRVTLYRFNMVNNRPQTVILAEANVFGSPFEEFHEAWTSFRSMAQSAYNIPTEIDVDDAYLFFLAAYE